MSEIRINIIDRNQTVSGDLHASFGEMLVAALTAEPETIEELEAAIERFVPRESDWSPFRALRTGENFEPYDAGLLAVDLAAKVIMADSTYSYYSAKGTVRIETDTGEDFNLPYCLSDDWKCVGSMPEFEFQQTTRRAEGLKNPPFDARAVLFGKALFEFIVSRRTAHKNSDDGDLFTNIHAEWLMTERSDLRNKTPREVLLEKREFIDSDLQSRALQWSFTNRQPPPLAKDSRAYRFAGFGTHEVVVYYDLFRRLLSECFAGGITESEVLEQTAADWLNNPQPDFSGRTPAKIIEAERQRINLTASAHECLIDENCEVCQMLAIDFIDTPMFWNLDGSNMEYDRFEFSFERNRADWEAEQRRWEEFSRKFDEEKSGKSGFSDDDEILF